MILLNFLENIIQYKDKFDICKIIQGIEEIGEIINKLQNIY